MVPRKKTRPKKDTYIFQVNINRTKEVVNVKRLGVGSFDQKKRSRIIVLKIIALILSVYMHHKSKVKKATQDKILR